MHSTMRVTAGIALIALGCVVAAAPLAQQPAPAFRAGVDAVRLDVRVVAADGAFVGDLTKNDLRIFEDGDEQTITAFSKIALPLPAPPAATAVPADVSSNATFRDGRVYLLLLDDLGIHPLREVTARLLARRFVEQYTSPADRVAIATTSGIGDGGTQDFTNNRSHVLTAIDRFKARSLPESNNDDFGLRARGGGAAGPPATTNRPQDVLPLQWLFSSVEFLGTVPDRRKALVFISEGVLDRSIDGNVESAHLEIQAAASRANVAIYSVDAVGLPTGPSGAIKPVAVPSDDPIAESRRRLRAGLMRLSDETGGAAVINSNAFDTLFERVVADSSTYYLLGYTSTHAPSKKLRRIEVRVNRPDAKAQVRRGYGTPSTSVAKRSAPPPGLPIALGEAFQSPVPISDIELAVSASPRRGSGDRASVAIVIEGRGREELDLFIGAADAGGKINEYKRGALRPGSGTGDTMQAAAQFELKPGRYHLRAAALQKDGGARGSVQHDFEVPDFSKETLSISGVTFIDSGRRPTLRRAFAVSESIDVAAEVYWKRGLEQSVSVATMLVDEAGNIVYRQEGSVAPSQRPTPGVDAGVTIDLKRYAPGSYRLVVEARTEGNKPIAAKREIPIVLTAR
jgi:VWFA-related protein